jgi:restriction endonuclease
VSEKVADCQASIVEIIDSIYDSRTMQPENARSNNVELQVDENKLAMPEFKALWEKISTKSVYDFVAETKGSMSSMQLRLMEESKIHCAREHFKAISNGSVVYDVVDSYQALLNLVKG